MGMIVSDPLRRRESLQHMKSSLPSWCNPEQTQQLNMLKVTQFSRLLGFISHTHIAITSNFIMLILFLNDFVLKFE